MDGGANRFRRRTRGYRVLVAVVLITGMSGTGKSAALAELARRGHRVVDTDYREWIEEVPSTDRGRAERLWRDDRIDALLSGHDDGALFVSGCGPNQASSIRYSMRSCCSARPPT